MDPDALAAAFAAEIADQAALLRAALVRRAATR
jgi:hypothetical protein